MSIVNCLAKAGKLISKEDAEFLKTKSAQLKSQGLNEAEADRAALRELTETADSDLGKVQQQIESAGGVVAKPTQATTPMPIAREVEGELQMVDANEVIAEIDGELSALESVIICAAGNL